MRRPATDNKIGKNRAPNAGNGRPKGAKNKLTKSAKDAFQHAFDTLGGPDALTAWAAANPSDFYKLYARLIPTETHIAGGDGEQLSLKVVFVELGEAQVENGDLNE